MMMDDSYGDRASQSFGRDERARHGAPKALSHRLERAEMATAFPHRRGRRNPRQLYRSAGHLAAIHISKMHSWDRKENKSDCQPHH
jgi:hypothetical protein